MSWIVDRRWAMAMVVRPAISTCSASRMRISVSVSTLDVASSRTRILRVERERPGERQELFLSDRQRRAAFRDGAVVAERHPVDEAIGVDGRRRPPDGLVRDGGVAEPDVLGDRAGKQIHVLQHEAEQPAQLVERHLADVDAVDQDAPAGDVVEAQQQVDEGRLPRPGRSHDADSFARPHLERHILEHVVCSVVREPDVVEDDVAESCWDQGSGIGDRRDLAARSADVGTRRLGTPGSWRRSARSPIPEPRSLT